MILVLRRPNQKIPLSSTRERSVWKLSPGHVRQIFAVKVARGGIAKQVFSAASNQDEFGRECVSTFKMHPASCVAVCLGNRNCGCLDMTRSLLALRIGPERHEPTAYAFLSYLLDRWRMATPTTAREKRGRWGLVAFASRCFIRIFQTQQIGIQFKFKMKSRRIRGFRDVEGKGLVRDI